jgi:hypothetical protein
MALVANINGVEVHSDKQVRSIVNSRVEFSDGSWCDTSTGQVSNNGRGYINLGGSGDSPSGEQTTKGPEKFSAKALDIQGVSADADVQVHSGSDIEVTISGSAGEVDAITSVIRGDTLFIESKSSRRGGGGTTIVSGFGGTVIGGGGVSVISSFGHRGSSSVIIGGSGGGSSTKLTVKIPVGTAVKVSGVNGNTTIGDIEAPLIAHVQGHNDVNAGRVTSAQLHAQGSGGIRVTSANGDVAANVQGSGDIDVEGGSMSNLTANVMGSGDVTVRGTADMASLSVMGSGVIDVEHVRSEPTKSQMGSGRIRVRRVG